MIVRRSRHPPMPRRLEARPAPAHARGPGGDFAGEAPRACPALAAAGRRRPGAGRSGGMRVGARRGTRHGHDHRHHRSHQRHPRPLSADRGPTGQCHRADRRPRARARQLPAQRHRRRVRRAGHGVLKSLRARRGAANVLLLHGGDTFSDDLLGNLTRGEATIALMNALGFQFLALGNHDFDYGAERTRELQAHGQRSRCAPPTSPTRTASRSSASRRRCSSVAGARVAVLALGYHNTDETGSRDNVARPAFRQRHRGRARVGAAAAQHVPTSSSCCRTRDRRSTASWRARCPASTSSSAAHSHDAHLAARTRRRCLAGAGHVGRRGPRRADADAGAGRPRYRRGRADAHAVDRRTPGRPRRRAR